MELLRRRRSASRWVYVLNGVVVLFLISLGIENGLSEVWLFVLLLGLCIVQAFYPTMLGWALIFTFFAAYTIAIAGGMANGPLDEYLLFLAIAAIPTALLLFFRPKRRE